MCPAKLCKLLDFRICKFLSIHLRTEENSELILSHFTSQQEHLCNTEFVFLIQQ